MINRQFSRYFFLGLLLGATYLFFKMMSAFLMPIFLAAVFCSLFYPLYLRMVGWFRGRRMLASAATCLVLLVGLLLPIYVVAQMVVKEAITFYALAEAKIREVVAQGDAGPIGRIQRLPLMRSLDLQHLDWKSSLQDTAATVGGALTKGVTAASSSTLKVVVTLFITLFTMFYFFRDGRRCSGGCEYLIPLDREHKDAIAARFASVARATVQGDAADRPGPGHPLRAHPVDLRRRLAVPLGGGGDAAVDHPPGRRRLVLYPAAFSRS